MSSAGISFAKALPAHWVPQAFEGELKDGNLDIVLNIFHLSRFSDKASLAKKSEHRGMTLLHMLAIRIIKDQRQGFSNHIDEPIEVLNKINPKDRKELVTAQDASGRSFLHLAAFCKGAKFNFVYKILSLIPKEDREDCLKTTDFLKGWAPLHQIAFITTNEDNLSEKTINALLDLLPDEAQQRIKEIKDHFGRDYKKIQELKQKKDAIINIANEKNREEERNKAAIAELMLHNSENYA